MNKRKYISAVVGAAVIVSMAGIIPAFAENNEGTSTKPMHDSNFGRMQKDLHAMNSDMRMGPAIVGTVTAVNGNTITVSRKGGPDKATSSVFTVDASTAKVFKNNATSTVSSIVVGDNVLVQGKLTGTNIVAITIRDGIMKGEMMKEKDIQNQFQGNGQPIIFGTISTISGNTVTVTNKSNVTYTVDASAAKILKGNSTSSVSSLVAGDTVLVQGTVNGNSIAAATIIDQAHPQKQSQKPENKGFLGKIGGFYAHLFGF